MELKNLYAYSKERFPFVNMALFIILFLTVLCVASYTSNQKIVIGINELVGCLAVILFFFRLRVFDEIKDYAIDSINYPQRVLQSGRIKLKHLKLISLAGLFIEIVWCLANGKSVLIWWFAAILFSFLMRYEFFISVFLKKHLLLYAFSHMMIMPLIITWIWSAYTEVAFIPKLLLLSSLSLVSGFAFEIARKIHIQENEKPLIDSYSKIVGYKSSIFLVLIILLAGVVIQFRLLQQINSRNWPFWLIGVLYTAIVGIYIIGILKPDEKRVRTNEVLVSLFMLFSYVSILIEIVS